MSGRSWSLISVCVRLLGQETGDSLVVVLRALEGESGESLERKGNRRRAAGDEGSSQAIDLVEI